jgi:hypothetical protein
MPSTSASQARLMRAVAHGWKKPGGGGPSVSVAKDFTAADKGHKFRSGGIMKNASPAMEKKHAAWMKSHGAPKSMVKEESAEAAEEKGEPKGFKKGGKVAPRPKKLPMGGSLPSSLPAGLASLGGPNPPMGPNAGAGPMGAMKRGGSVKCAKGGQLTATDTENKNSDSKIGGGIEKKAPTSTAVVKMKGAGMASKGTSPTSEYAKGGSVSRGDGCATKGKTRGRVR